MEGLVSLPKIEVAQNPSPVKVILAKYTNRGKKMVITNPELPKEGYIWAGRTEAGEGFKELVKKFPLMLEDVEKDIELGLLMVSMA